MDYVGAAKKATKLINRSFQSLKDRGNIAQRPAEFARLPTGAGRYRAAAYFADADTNLYQLRQWYGPLAELNRRLPVVIIVRNPHTALAIADETDLPVFFGRTIGDIETMLASQAVRQVFYVNQNIRNFQMMRFGGPAHVFVCHGESEKAYMWSNQLKAYDYVFSAGQAAQDRLERHLIDFDVTSRTRLVGRPQIDVPGAPPQRFNPAFPTVLYAPTWEGDRPSMAYGSVSSHGLDLVGALVDSRRFNVIIRTHPRSGINVPSYGKDVTALAALMHQAAANGPTYLFDTSPHWGWQGGVADIAIADVSAVAYDWMATGKPLLVTRPASLEAVVADSPALTQVPSLGASEAATVVDRLDTMLSAGPDKSYAALVQHYFGDTTPGASMDRWITAALDVDARRAAAISSRPRD